MERLSSPLILLHKSSHSSGPTYCYLSFLCTRRTRATKLLHFSCINVSPCGGGWEGGVGTKWHAKIVTFWQHAVARNFHPDFTQLASHNHTVSSGSASIKVHSAFRQTWISVVEWGAEVREGERARVGWGEWEPERDENGGIGVREGMRKMRVGLITICLRIVLGFTHLKGKASILAIKTICLENKCRPSGYILFAYLCIHWMWTFICFNTLADVCMWITHRALHFQPILQHDLL